MNFATGQRWLSQSEPELGLGLIRQWDQRTVTLEFPLVGESRTYAAQNAPLSRLQLSVKDSARSTLGWSMEITSVSQVDSRLQYQGSREDTGEQVALDEQDLHPDVMPSSPLERLLSGQMDNNNWFDLRYRTLLRQHQYLTSPLLGLQGVRIDLIHHQLHIAEEVGKRAAPRVLLADEVGLGKTIEAALIIHQQLRSGRAERVLIVVPETLLHQWLVEMLRRVNLHFSLFDEERCENQDSGNPFESEQLVLCSQEFITHNSQYYQMMLDSDWDLLVVDEAHHLRWDEQHPSQEYRVIERLAAKIPGILLLTATPDQLGHESHFARLRLLDAERFYDYRAFIEQEKSFRQIANLAEALMDDKPLVSEQVDQLHEMVGQKIGLDTTVERDTAVTRLLDYHGTGRVLFRNRRASIAGFKARHLHRYPLQSHYPSVDSEDIRQGLYPELGQHEWWKADPRVDWLIGLLQSMKNQKVLVICAHRETAMGLEQALRVREGLKAVVFHEGLTIIERDRAAAYFADPESGAQTLICSEIGSEGRNFQFSNQLVLFDLPVNPDLLEQRIGRLDRIGQQKDIDIHTPFFQDTAQQVLADWYHLGLNAFEKTCPTGGTVFEELSEVLTLCLKDPQNQAQCRELLTQTAEVNRILLEKMESGRDRLLELHSSGRGKIEPLVEQIHEMDTSHQLRLFLSETFDVIGVDQEEKDAQAFILRPTDQMFMSLPGLPDEGLTITYERDYALLHEDVQFMSWDHPIVSHAIDLVLGENKGTTAISLLHNKAIAEGTVLLELIFTLQVSAPKSLQLFRFLPATPIRMLLDGQGRDLAQKVSLEQLSRQLHALDKSTINQLLTALGSDIRRGIAGAEKLATERATTILADAETRIKRTLDAELERLETLKEKNPLVRQSELDTLQRQKTQMLERLSSAQCHLDAVRVIVNTH